MRFIHTSDTHLGHQQYNKTNAQGLNQREEDIAAGFHAVVDAAIAQPPDAFLHAGDLFDGVRPNNRALAHALDGFLKLSEAAIPTIIIAGNHEHPKLRATGSPLRLLAHLPHIHVVYRGRAESIPTGDVVVHAVPQCADAETLAAQVAALPRGPGNLLMIHGAVQSIPAFRNAEFNEQTLDPAWFAGFDYVALGHYHGTQEVTPNAHYCGSSERVSIAESGETKGYLDVTLGEPPKFKPVPTRPYVDCPIIYGAPLDASGVYDAVQSAIQSAPDGAVVRVRVEGLKPALRGSLDERAMHALGKRFLEFQIRTSFETAEHEVAGASWTTLGEAFDDYVANRPIENREALLALAKDVLE